MLRNHDLYENERQSNFGNDKAEDTKVICDDDNEKQLNHGEALSEEINVSIGHTTRGKSAQVMKKTSKIKTTSIFGQNGSSSPYKWLCHSVCLWACHS